MGRHASTTRGRSAGSRAHGRGTHGQVCEALGLPSSRHTRLCTCRLLLVWRVASCQGTVGLGLVMWLGLLLLLLLLLGLLLLPAVAVVVRRRRRLHPRRAPAVRPGRPRTPSRGKAPNLEVLTILITCGIRVYKIRAHLFWLICGLCRVSLSCEWV